MDEEWFARHRVAMKAGFAAHPRFDMVAVYRAMGEPVWADRCPKCGRWAHAEAGNHGEDYWSITNCAKCGRWETIGGPVGWVFNPGAVKSRKLEEA